MENAIIVLITVFIMMFVVNLINGNMIGRHDGVRANSNFMVCLSCLASLFLFFSCRKRYNVWSSISQIITILYVLFTIFLHLFKASMIVDGYKPILISFVVIHSILYLCLFVDIMMYERKYGNRF